VNDEIQPAVSSDDLAGENGEFVRLGRRTIDQLEVSTSFQQ
jgi:hypothetical protein